MRAWGVVLLIAGLTLVPAGRLVGRHEGSAAGNASGTVEGARQIRSIDLAGTSTTSCSFDADTLADAGAERTVPPHRSYCPIDGARQR